MTGDTRNALTQPAKPIGATTENVGSQVSINHLTPPGLISLDFISRGNELLSLDNPDCVNHNQGPTKAKRL